MALTMFQVGEPIALPAAPFHSNCIVAKSDVPRLATTRDVPTHCWMGELALSIGDAMRSFS